MNRLAAALCVLVFAAIAPVSALADGYTYTYTGNDFTYAYLTDIYPPDTPFTTSDFVSGSFTLASALTPGMTQQYVTPASFSFSDGVQTLSSAAGDTGSFQVATDATGNITAWVIYIGTPNGDDTISTEDGIDDPIGAPSLWIDDGGSWALGYPNLASEFAENGNDPGTWQVPIHYAPATAPEPSGLLLLGTSVIGALAAVRRRVFSA